MLDFVICDDNEIILNKLSKMLEALFIKHNLDAHISFTSTNPSDILNYVKENTVTALFLDIDLKSEITGLDLAGKIREINKNAYIIFTSAHMEYILVAYKYKTFDFIPKPITSQRLEETIVRIIYDMNDNSCNNHFIRLNYKNTIINEDSIKFIKRDGMKLVFYTDNRQYEAYTSFTKIEHDLPSNFIRCHKSYIANINKVTDIDISKNILFFGNKNYTCFIGPKYKNKLLEVIKNDRNTSNNLD